MWDPEDTKQYWGSYMEDTSMKTGYPLRHYSIKSLSSRGHFYILAAMVEDTNT